MRRRTTAFIFQMILHLSDDTSAFFFPFAASIFHAGGCIVQMVGVCFLANFYGVSLSSAQIAVLILNAIVVSMTAPGIPGGAIIVMAPILTSAGIPLEGMAMLLAVDTVPDMFRTTATVSCWLGAASLLKPRVQSAAIDGALEVTRHFGHFFRRIDNFHPMSRALNESVERHQGEDGFGCAG